MNIIMTERNNSENKNDEKEFSFFTCIGVGSFTIFLNMRPT